MKWFEGTIAEAVGMAKSRHAVFVVYIEGTDEASVATTSVVNKENVSSTLESADFVAIKLANGSEGHRQFAEIYKLVPAPSIFFIGQNGQAIDVVVGDVNSEAAENKLRAAFQKCNDYLKGKMVAPGQSQPEPKPASLPKAAPAPAPSPSVTSPSSSSTIVANEPPVATLPVEERVEKAKQLIVQKNEEKKKQELQKEKDAEIERRKLGQSLQKAKQQKTDLELREMKVEREKEKREEAEARKRILEQIAQDRAERLQRQQMASSNLQAENPVPSAAAQRPAPSNANVGRLQFKLPTGETRTHSFPPETTLSQVRQFVDNNIDLPFRDYEMGTMFPRQQFNRTDNEKDLRALGLLPSAVILILPTYGSLNPARNLGLTNALYAFLMTLFSPLLSVANYVKLFIFGGGGSAASASSSDSQRPASSSSPSQPTSGVGRGLGMRGGPFQSRTIRKRGNIHTLGDDNDSNDENNTWNGNSTQQM